MEPTNARDNPRNPQSPAPPPTLSTDYQRPWPAYFDAVRDQPPRETLRRALALLGKADGGTRWALDIACGEGRDTREILRHDPAWRVVAIDASAEGLDRLARSLTTEEHARVTTIRRSMEDLAREGLPLDALPPGLRSALGAFHLVNASFALPFCEPAAFGDLWAWIRRSLRPGGCFAGQLFGDRDSWAAIRPASHHTRDQALTLLQGFDLDRFEEVEKDGSDAMGGTKHHHLFHIVGRWTSQPPTHPGTPDVGCP